MLHPLDTNIWYVRRERHNGDRDRQDAGEREPKRGGRGQGTMS